MLGGGAAGLMCAAVAAEYGARVTVVEHQQVPGRKIRISGGGRCNFTNRVVSAKNFISANEHFATSALARFTPADFIALVTKHRIAWHEKTLGQLFCDGSAQQIIDMLMYECTSRNVEFRFGTSVGEVTKSDNFLVTTSGGVLVGRTLVVATGGLSIPQMGATSAAYEIARRFSHAVIPTHPALVPLRAHSLFSDRFGGLAGVSMPCIASANGTSFREAMLFTHGGLSGPAILQISSYITPPTQISLNVFPDGIPHLLQNIPQADKRLIRSIASLALPQRFATAWPDARFGLPRNRLNAGEFAATLQALERWQVDVLGTEGYAKAEVTRGGIDTSMLSSKTMESKLTPGLYFIGECVDVTGWLGGYNFQWAWASGYAAGTAIRDCIAASISDSSSR